MNVKIDAVGRIVIPKPLREAFGLAPGSSVDVSAYGTGIHVQPGGRTARLREVDGRLVAESDTSIDDDDVLGLLDAGRR